MANIVVLKNYAKVNKQVVFLAKIREKSVAALEKASPAMETQAKKDVLKVVYEPAANPKFERSGNMAAATAISVDSDPDSVTTNVFLDPEKATLPFDYVYGGGVDPAGLKSYDALKPGGGSGEMWYPIYVIKGIFFSKQGKPRDFRLKWVESIFPMVKVVLGKAVKAIR